MWVMIRTWGGKKLHKDIYIITEKHKDNSNTKNCKVYLCSRHSHDQGPIKRGWPYNLISKEDNFEFSSIQSLSHVWLFATPWKCSTPGLLVHHQLLESTQTHVHWIGDAIQPSHPLSSPSPPALNLSQHQGLFKWVSSSHQVPKVLEFQLQHQSLQWTPRTDLL